MRARLQERELRVRGKWELGIRVSWAFWHSAAFNFLNLKKKKSVLHSCRVPCVSLPCPRVRTYIKKLDTSFGMSDTDFHVSVSDTGHAGLVACPCIPVGSFVL